MNSNIGIAALNYVNRGWMPVPLHGVNPDPLDRNNTLCQCGAPCGKSAGKHPIFGAWQQRDWRGWDGWANHHGNVGIATGTPSGFWVLDYDPDGVGPEPAEATALVRQLTAGSAHVRTGGGGLHWRFALPTGCDDWHCLRCTGKNGGPYQCIHGMDFPVTNARGRLPKGLDVRGTGGQVVAPPSVSGKGPYVELRPGVDAAPGWLLDLIRPDDRPPAGQVAPPEVPASVPGTSIGVGSDREQRYAIGALQAACQEYAALQDGRRGEAAWHLACRAVELMNLGRLQPDDVRNMVMGAIDYARLNGPPGGLAPTEALRLWERARAEVGDRRAEITGPDPIAAGAMPDGFAVPFSPAPQDGAMTSGSPSMPTGGSGLPPMIDAGTAGPISAGPAPAPASDPFDQAVRIEQWKIAVRDEARRRIDAARAGARPPLELELIEADKLDAIAPLTALVPDFLFVDSLARINGRPGQGKSFVVADLACSVASGTPWAGRPVRRGPVLAIVAEGVSGFRGRIRAWEREHGIELAPADFALFPRAPLVGGPEWPAFVALCAARGVALVTVDTQARATVGLKENDASDMGQFVDGLEALRAATGACVLVVHHAGKSDDGGRGSNAVEGAMSSEFMVTRAGPVVTMRTTKQKDIEESPALVFDLRPVQLDRDLGDGMSEPAVPSAVLVYRDPASVVRDVPTESKERRDARWIWQHINRYGNGADGVTRAEVNKAFAVAIASEEPNRTNAKARADRAFRVLISLRLLAKIAGRQSLVVVVLADQSADGVLSPNSDGLEIDGANIVQSIGDIPLGHPKV